MGLFSTTVYITVWFLPQYVCVCISYEGYYWKKKLAFSFANIHRDALYKCLAKC